MQSYETESSKVKFAQLDEEYEDNDNNGMWSDGIPDHLLVHVFQYLSFQDRVQSSYVCKKWYECFNSIYLWRHFEFKFFEETDGKLLQCGNSVFKQLRSICINVDPGLTINRKNACELLGRLASLEDRRLKSISVIFRGDNPLFYAGKEFCFVLEKLFRPPNDVPFTQQLIHVDFCGLSVAIEGNLLLTLAENHPNIEFLNIQNKNLFTLIAPATMVSVVQKCRKLKDLRVYYSSLSEAVLEGLSEKDRTPLEFFSLCCRRSEKYVADIPEEKWSNLCNKNKGIRLGLVFDATVPVNKIWEVMKPGLPLSLIRFETFTTLNDEINYVADNYFKTLEKISVSTTPSVDLEKALVKLAACCDYLKVLYVYCTLTEETVTKILDVCPTLKESGCYLLKYIKEPHPWGDPKEIERLFIYHRLKS